MAPPSLENSAVTSALLILKADVAKQRAVAASPGAAVTAAKPKIALKMDFGSFSAKA